MILGTAKFMIVDILSGSGWMPSSEIEWLSFLKRHLLSLIFKFTAPRPLKTDSNCCRYSLHEVLSRYVQWNLSLCILVTLRSKMYLMHNRFPVGLHSSAIFQWWLQKWFSVLLWVLNQYSGILMQLVRARFYNFVALLVILLWLARANIK